MYYVALDGRFYDDGHGMATTPAYGVGADGTRYELDEGYSSALTERFERDTKKSFPIGDYVARVTKAFGFEPCEPCQKRQHALNEFGGRVSNFWERAR